MAADLEHVRPRLGQRRPHGEPHAAQRFHDVVDAAGEGGDVVGVDRREQRDAELVAAELAVALGVDDAVVAQDARDGEGVGHRLVDVDGGDDVAALVRVGHERRGVARRLGPAVDRGGGLVAAAGRPLEPALLVDPLDLLVGQEDRGQRRGVVGLVLAAVLEGDAEVERRGHPALRRRDPRDAIDGRRRGRREPEATVGRQALLRGEVVDVDLARLEAQTAGRRGGVDDHEPVGAGGPLERHGHAGGGLVVGEAVGVDVGVGHRERVRAGIGEEVGRLVEVRRGGGDLGELRRELAEAEVLAAPIDEPEARRRPRTRWCRRCRAAPRSRRGGRAARPARCGAPRPRTAPGPAGGRCRGSRGRRRPAPRRPRGGPSTGPQPKRPSAGSRSTGILMSGSGGVTRP